VPSGSDTNDAAPAYAIRLDSRDPASRWNFPAAPAEPVRELICLHDGRTVLKERGRAVRHWTHPLDAVAWLESAARALPAGHRFVGYVGYDFARFCEDVRVTTDDEHRTPLLRFVEVRRDASAADNATPRPVPPPASLFAITSANRYLQHVRKIVEYIAAGDIYQANYAQRFVVDCPHPPADVYARLRAASAAVYGALLDFGDYAVVSNSPELFLRITPNADGTRTVLNRPIKGTRPNQPGRRDELVRSVKDQAELAMIVDLQRNDLGRVCEIGSVRVTQPREIEEHPTVLHGVATVEGTLRRDATLADVLRSAFPCGSITGCPKIRAMQIIDELEPVSRGPYCGAVGYLDPDGTIEFNVAIRTMLIRAGRADVTVGGGIVADSVPEDEYAETITKARAMLAALGVDADDLSLRSAELPQMGHG
jgi:anthranilate/para-aminobenzoate synthase component I